VKTLISLPGTELLSSSFSKNHTNSSSQSACKTMECKKFILQDILILQNYQLYMIPLHDDHWPSKNFKNCFQIGTTYNPFRDNWQKLWSPWRRAAFLENVVKKVISLSARNCNVRRHHHHHLSLKSITNSLLSQLNQLANSIECKN
jgi:hypothetical protein